MQVGGLFFFRAGLESFKLWWGALGWLWVLGSGVGLGFEFWVLVSDTVVGGSVLGEARLCESVCHRAESLGEQD